MIRPIRDEMVIANGVENIQQLYAWTIAAFVFVIPAFGWICSRFNNRMVLLICTLFFSLNLVLFYFLFQLEPRPIWVTRVFFIWVNIFNMFIVSLFWSFMNDLFDKGQSQRLFAVIAAGGTAGALVGPLITTALVEAMGLSFILILSAIILASTLVGVFLLSRLRIDKKQEAEHISVTQEAQGGSVWNGIHLIWQSHYLRSITIFVLLYSVSITFVQIQQAELVERTFSDPIARTKLFSNINFFVNLITLLLQVFVTSKLMRKIGFTNVLILLPLGLFFGYIGLIIYPILIVMVLLEVFRRACDYAITKPAREMLFNIVTQEQKYKSKNVIDTVVVRGGNMVAAILDSVSRSVPMINTALSVGLAGLWCLSAWKLGSEYETKTAHAEKSRALFKEA